MHKKVIELLRPLNIATRVHCFHFRSSTERGDIGGDDGARSEDLLVVLSLLGLFLFRYTDIVRISQVKIKIY